MRVNAALLRSMVVNLCLLLVSCVVGLALCELSLWLFYPKYRDLAEAQFHSHARRIWARTPNSRDWMHHPDTGLPHAFYHNNLALRQHRNFSATDLAAATTIGVFGDSFTENSGMPVHYSFTEPLDYLLNQSGKPFNVLNFGVDGYGPGQSLLHYEYFPYAEDLDHVFYVFCINDLWNLYETGLFHLDEAGRLERNEMIRASWWVPLIRRLQTTYLVLDVSGRWSSFLAEATINLEDLRRGYDERVKDERWRVMTDAFYHGRLANDELKNSLATFRQLIRYWKHQVENNGSTLSVVLLPNDPPQPFVVNLLKAEDVEVIDLYTCFGDADPAISDRPWNKSPYRFKKDHHWNEAGNRLAAVCLYRVLTEKTGLPPLSESRLREVLFQYYATFRDKIPLKVRGGSISLETTVAIRKKYAALEMNALLKDTQEKSLDLIVQPEKRIITSYFDVYLDRNHLFYVKEDCRPADTQAGFFVHGIPVNNSRFRDSGLPFDHWRFKLTWLGVKTERHGCVAKIPLPRYRLRYIRTGQFVPDEGRLWEGEGWTDPNRVGDKGPEFPGAAGTRIISSHFDVYLDGRDLVYHKAYCGPADRGAPFFLHVTPVDETDLPPERGEYGFHNLDFQPRSEFRADEFGCTIARRIPGYALRHIRTGQSVKDTQGNYLLLWEGDFSMNQGAGGEEGGP